MNKKIFLFIFGMFFLFGMLSFVSADYRFENNSGTTLMRLHSSNGNLSVLGNISTNNYFIGDGRFITNIDTSSLNLSSINYWNKSGSNLYYNEGNVGIGTTNPGAKLDVEGNIRIDNPTGSANIRVNSLNNTYNSDITFAEGDASRFLSGWDTSNNNYRIYSYGIGEDALTVDYTSGNVGIGTSSPSEKLDVNGDIKSNGLLVGNQYISSGKYSYSNGILITTDINVDEVMMMELYIEGNSYSAWGAFGGKVTAYNYVAGGYIHGPVYVANGMAPPEVRIFHHEGVVKFWMAQTNPSQTYRFRLGTNYGAKITNIQNLVMPSTGVTNEVVVTPKTVINNNLGIGTSSPQQKLHVNGSAIINGTLVGLSNATDPTGAVTKSQLDAINSALSGNVSDTYVPYTGATQNVDLGANNFSVGGSDLFVDSSTGNVGIGTSSPGAKLEVKDDTGAGSTDLFTLNRKAGYGRTTFTQTYDSTYFANGKTLSLKNDAGTTFAMFAGNNAGSQTNFLIPTGNVGIGMTSPNYVLDINKSNSDAVNVGGNLGYSGYRITSGSQQWAFRGSSNSMSLTDVSGGSVDRLIIKAESGNVGIGTTSPQTKQHIWTGEVGGSSPQEVLRLEGDWGSIGSGPLLRFTNYHTSGDTPNANEYNLGGIQGRDFAGNWAGGLAFMTPNSGDTGGSALVDRMVIRENGNVGIGTTSPQQKLHVTGNAVFNGTINTDGNKIINLANGTAAQDAVTKSQLDSVSAGSLGAITGSGSAMRVALWNGTTSLNNSNIYQGASGNIGVDSQSPSSKLEVNGTFDASSNGGSIKVDSSGNIRIGI